MPTNRAEGTADTPQPVTTGGKPAVPPTGNDSAMPTSPVGSEDNPIVSPGVRIRDGRTRPSTTKLGKRQCAKCARWFWVQTPNQRNCHECAALTQTAAAAKAVVSGKVAQSDELTRLLDEAQAVDIEAGLGPDADTPSPFHAGAWGIISCTPRERLAAQLDNGTNSDVLISIATKISVSELLDMREGGGRQPMFQELVAFYTHRRMFPALALKLKELRTFIQRNESKLDPKERIKAETQLLTLQQRLLDTLPKPPKRELIDFGEENLTPAAQLAEKLVGEFMLTRPANPGDGEEVGGPGWRR